MIQINGQQSWLYAAVDSENEQISPFTAIYVTTTASTERFCGSCEKHNVSNAVFLVGHAEHLAIALRRSGTPISVRSTWNRNAVERVFRGLKRRTHSFGSSFSHINPETAEHGCKPSPPGGTR